NLFTVNINKEHEAETRTMAMHLMAKIRLSGMDFHAEEFSFLSEFTKQFGVDEDDVKSIIGFAHRYPIRKFGSAIGVLRSDVEEAFHTDLDGFMIGQACFVHEGKPMYFAHDFKDWLSTKGCAV